MRREARFLLHVWCDTERGDAWRARLEELATREVKLFADLEALNGYLQNELKLRPWTEAVAEEDATQP
jgi:hypothetical protein